MSDVKWSTYILKQAHSLSGRPLLLILGTSHPDALVSRLNLAFLFALMWCLPFSPMAFLESS